VIEPATIPDLPRCFVEGEAASLQRVDATHFQVRCDLCLRSSPVVTGDEQGWLTRIADLGWKTTGGSAWTCPLCHDPDSGRHMALPGETVETCKGLGGGCFQAQCDSCVRSSPIVSGVLDDFSRRATELGWAMTSTGMWRCPLCRNRKLGRYALP